MTSHPHESDDQPEPLYCEHCGHVLAVPHVRGDAAVTCLICGTKPRTGLLFCTSCARGYDSATRRDDGSLAAVLGYVARAARRSERRRRARRVTASQRSAAWTAIDRFLRASGGDPHCTSVAKQRAVVLVERSLDAIAEGRNPCWCQYEPGDSPCPTHGMDGQ